MPQSTPYQWRPLCQPEVNKMNVVKYVPLGGGGRYSTWGRRILTQTSRRQDGGVGRRLGDKGIYGNVVSSFQHRVHIFYEIGRASCRERV